MGFSLLKSPSLWGRGWGRGRHLGLLSPVSGAVLLPSPLKLHSDPTVYLSASEVVWHCILLSGDVGNPVV